MRRMLKKIRYGKSNRPRCMAPGTVFAWKRSDFGTVRGRPAGSSPAGAHHFRKIWPFPARKRSPGAITGGRESGLQGGARPGARSIGRFAGRGVKDEEFQSFGLVKYACGETGPEGRGSRGCVTGVHGLHCRGEQTAVCPVEREDDGFSVQRGEVLEVQRRLDGTAFHLWVGDPETRGLTDGIGAARRDREGDGGGRERRSSDL